ncbi:MAG: hypothetical protein ABGY71_04780 [bacterium]|nr:hypothetical protein [Planctomycetota bacterium]HIL52114.1 hypothetical protein [Planctomycetota bacterium]
MTHRIGTCSDCGATYKLPASFAADRARCKKCDGVVEIARASGGQPAKAAAAPPVPTRQPRTQPKSKPNREGPSMKERLLATRKAEAAAAQAAAPPPAKPAAKAAGSSRRSTTSRRSTSRRGADQDESSDGNGQEGGSRRSRREKKKQSALPAMLGLLALIVIVAGAGWYLTNQDDKVATGDEVAAAEKTVQNTTLADINEALLGAAQDAAADDAVAAAADSADAPDEAPVEQLKKPAKKDPASVDLLSIADFGPIAGCSDDRFAVLNQLVATMVDPNAGAAGNRARIKLEAAGREAFPAILNGMRRLDLTDEDGEFRSADVCQKALQSICNGNNFGWKYPSNEPDAYHYFDKRVIQTWCKTWDKVKADDAAWAKLAKLDKVEKAGESPAARAAAEDALDDALDDLDF